MEIAAAAASGPGCGEGAFDDDAFEEGASTSSSSSSSSSWATPSSRTRTTAGRLATVAIQFRLPDRLFGTAGAAAGSTTLECVDLRCCGDGEPSRVVLSGAPLPPNNDRAGTTTTTTTAPSKRSRMIRAAKRNRRFDRLTRLAAGGDDTSRNVSFVYPPRFREKKEVVREIGASDRARGDGAWQYVTVEARPERPRTENHDDDDDDGSSGSDSDDDDGGGDGSRYPPVSVRDTICVATVLLECGVVPMEEPATEFDLESPAGPIAVAARCRRGAVESIAFEHPPSFVEHRAVSVLVLSSIIISSCGCGVDKEEFGLFSVEADVVYSGMWYCLVDLRQFRKQQRQEEEEEGRPSPNKSRSSFPKLRIDPNRGEELCRMAERIRVACFEQFPVDRDAGGETDEPRPSALAFWDSEKTRFDASAGTLVMSCWDDLRSSSSSSSASCVASMIVGERDRRLFDGGTAAIMTVLHDRGMLSIGETFDHRGLLERSSGFTGTILGTVAPGPNGASEQRNRRRRPAVRTRIRGSARITQYSRVVVRETDDGSGDDSRRPDPVPSSAANPPRNGPVGGRRRTTLPPPCSDLRTDDTAENTFFYDGGRHHVPKGFAFPKVAIREGLSLWFRGHEIAVDTATDAVAAAVDGGGGCCSFSSARKRIRPYRDLLWKHIPCKRAKKIYSLEWRHLFTYLEEGVAEATAKIPTPSATEAEIDAYYELCKDLLRRKVSYYYGDGRSLRNRTSSWSNKVQRSSILKHGTPSDVAQLPEPTLRNKPRVGDRPLKRRGRLKSAPKHPDRQEKRLRKLNRLQELAALSRRSSGGKATNEASVG